MAFLPIARRTLSSAEGTTPSTTGSSSTRHGDDEFELSAKNGLKLASRSRELTGLYAIARINDATRHRWVNDTYDEAMPIFAALYHGQRNAWVKPIGLSVEDLQVAEEFAEKRDKFTEILKRQEGSNKIVDDLWTLRSVDTWGLDDLLGFVCGTLESLARLHAALGFQLAHNDVKPGNIGTHRRGCYYYFDFEFAGANGATCESFSRKYRYWKDPGRVCLAQDLWCLMKTWLEVKAGCCAIVRHSARSTLRQTHKRLAEYCHDHFSETPVNVAAYRTLIGDLMGYILVPAASPPH
jgi:hypothetical protein